MQMWRAIARTGTQLILLAGFLAISTSAFELEWLEDNAVRARNPDTLVVYSNRKFLHTEARGETLTSLEIQNYLPRVILPQQTRTLSFRWQTTIPTERGLQYEISARNNPLLSITFDVPLKGQVPTEREDFRVFLQCKGSSTKTVNVAFTILCFAPPGHLPPIRAEINMQKECPRADEGPVALMRPVPANEVSDRPALRRPRCRKIKYANETMCSKLCAEPTARKLNKLICGNKWVMHGTFTGSRSVSCRRLFLQFQAIEPLVLSTETSKLEKRRGPYAFKVSLPKTLSKCKCVKKMKEGKKYALLGVGAWREKASDGHFKIKMKGKTILRRRGKLPPSALLGQRFNCNN